MRTVFALPYGSRNGLDSEGSWDSKGGGIGGGGGTPLLLLELEKLLSTLLFLFFSSLSTLVKLLCTLLLFEPVLFTSVCPEDVFLSTTLRSTLIFRA